MDLYAQKYDELWLIRIGNRSFVKQETVTNTEQISILGNRVAKINNCT